MRVMGASAISAKPLLDALRDCAFNGRAAMLWCDGDDVQAVFADEGDTIEDVLAIAQKVMPQ